MKYEQREITWVDASLEKPPLWNDNFSKSVLCYDFGQDVCVIGWYDYELDKWSTNDHELHKVDYWAFVNKPSKHDRREVLKNKLLYPENKQDN